MQTENQKIAERLAEYLKEDEEVSK